MREENENPNRNEAGNGNGDEMGKKEKEAKRKWNGGARGEAENKDKKREGGLKKPMTSFAATNYSFSNRIYYIFIRAKEFQFRREIVHRYFSSYHFRPRSVHFPVRFSPSPDSSLEAWPPFLLFNACVTSP